VVGVNNLVIHIPTNKIIKVTLICIILEIITETYKKLEITPARRKGNLLMFCEIISNRKQIPHQVRDDGHLYFWSDHSQFAYCKQIGVF
jgi:hypothetical protein